MSNKLLTNSLLNAQAGMLLLLTGFGSTIITGRLLGPEANGIIAFSLWLVTAGSSIAELGSSIMLLKVLPKLQADGYDETRRMGFGAVQLRPTIYAVIILATLYSLAFLTSEDLHWAHTAPTVAMITGLLFIVQAIGSFSKFYLIGEQRLGAFLSLTLIVSVVQIAGVLLGALWYGVEGALIGYVLGQAVLFIRTIPVMLAKRDYCDVPKSYLSNSSVLLTLQYLVDAIFLTRLELFFLLYFWDVEVVGYYAVGLSIANMALQLPIQLTGSLLPYYSERLHLDREKGVGAHVVGNVTRNLAYITLPMSIGLAAISGPLVVSIFGEAFRPSGSVVALLALAAPGAAFAQTLSLYLLSIDKARERLNISLISGAFMAVGCVVAIPFLGAEGAAIVRIAGYVLMCALMIRQTGFGAGLHTMYASLLRITVASLATAMAAVVVLDYVHGVLGIGLAIVAGAAVYVPALRLVRAVKPGDADAIRGFAERLPSRFRTLFHFILDFVVATPRSVAMPKEAGE